MKDTIKDKKIVIIDIETSGLYCGEDGKELYESAIKLAKDAGCYNLTLNVWSCSQSALKSYKSLGLLPQKIGMELILK